MIGLSVALFLLVWCILQVVSHLVNNPLLLAHYMQLVCIQVAPLLCCIFPSFSFSTESNFLAPARIKVQGLQTDRTEQCNSQCHICEGKISPAAPAQVKSRNSAITQSWLVLSLASQVFTAAPCWQRQQPPIVALFQETSISILRLVHVCKITLNFPINISLLPLLLLCHGDGPKRWTVASNDQPKET